MKKLNVGFIGNGKSVNRYHAPYLLALPEQFKIHTIYARNHENDPWDEIEDVHYVATVEELLSEPKIDLVIVATRQDTHYEYAKMSIEAGKNTLVEKPFTSTEAEAKELFALAEEKGVLLEAYQNRRFDSDFLTLQKVLKEGKLGQLFELENNYDYYRPEVAENAGEYSRLSAFVSSHACHTIDQVIALFGIPERSTYDVRSMLGENRMNDYFDIDLFYKNPLKVSVRSSYSRIKSRPRFVAYGTKGMFIKETEDRQEEDLKHFYLPKNHPDFGVDSPRDYGTLIWMDDEGVYHEEKVVSENGNYARYYMALYDTLVNGKDPLVAPEQTIELMHQLESACLSLEQRLEKK